MYKTGSKWQTTIAGKFRNVLIVEIMSILTYYLIYMLAELTQFNILLNLMGRINYGFHSKRVQMGLYCLFFNSKLKITFNINNV